MLPFTYNLNLFYELIQELHTHCIDTPRRQESNSLPFSYQNSFFLELDQTGERPRSRSQLSDQNDASSYWIDRAYNL
jgi:hypothetical protein